MIDPGQLQLWRLISPMLPIGAYAYSTGLEAAVEAVWVHDESSAREWIHGLLTHNLQQVDLPLFARAYAAWQRDDREAVLGYQRQLLAMRESRELRQEDLQLGDALKVILKEILPPEISPQAPTHEVSFAVIYAFACTRLDIELTGAASGLAFAWCENQVAAAMKLIPLGQRAGQRIMTRLIASIPAVVQHALAMEDESIGCLLPRLAIASAQHEAQYSRLFRS
ncbi:MAG: urease accessory protein UreF [Gammaproteobacteria bacterium]|nr:urease accessory protein UreF [Gammaproteobacteria bacterium]